MLDEVLGALKLTPNDSGGWRIPALPTDHRGVAFGGQLLGQAIVAATELQPKKRVKSVQTIFARGILKKDSVDITAKSLHDGQTIGSVSVEFIQNGRVCAAMLVLLDVNEPDLVRHQIVSPPSVPLPDPKKAVEHGLIAPESIIIDDVNVLDPDSVGPATLQFWMRFADAPANDQTLARALVAHSTDGWIIGTGMRPHKGIGQSMAHISISTGVLSHALSFHRDIDICDWLLVDNEAIYAGNGRVYGRGNIFTQSGELVASFVQESLIRHFPAGQNPVGKEATIF